MELENRKRILLIISIFMGFSFALLSVQFLLLNNNMYIGITMLCSFLCGVVFVYQTSRSLLYKFKNKILALLIMSYICICMIKEMYNYKKLNFIEIFGEIDKLCWILAIPALTYLMLWVWGKIKEYLSLLFKGLNEKERNIYFFITICLTVIVFVLYLSDPDWYFQYNRIYSIDSGWCYYEMFQKMDYYDIRHPALSIVSYPIFAIVKIVLQMIIPSHLLDTTTAIAVQLINGYMLLLIGLMISKMSKSKWVLYIYIASFPFVLFIAFFEKYQLCVFLLVLYVYKRFEDEKKSGYDIVLATAVMPTSIMMFCDQLVGEKTVKDKVKDCLKVAGCGILFIVCSGRVHLFDFNILMNDLLGTKNYITSYSLNEVICSYTKLLHGTLWNMSSNGDPFDMWYRWDEITSSFSVIGSIVFAIVIIGILVGRKERFTKSCTIWLMMSIILVIFVQWSAQESPLFAIYFSWAIIPLFQKGFDYVIKKIGLSTKLAYGLLIGSMYVVNILSLYDIGLYMKRF